jgi:hypothetical protein
MPAPRARRPKRDRRPPRFNVWLATLSTVVATATGMFALRDYIFASDPSPRPSRPATSPSASSGTGPEAIFAAAVARACRRMVTDERANVARFRSLKRRLASFETGYDQRNAILEVVDSGARDTHRTLSVFRGLDVYPRMLDPIAARVRRYWRANFERQLKFAEDLRDADSFGALVEAAKRHGERRDAMIHDGGRVQAGLRKLGGERCGLPSVPSVAPFQLIGPVGTAGVNTSRSAALAPEIARAPLSRDLDPEAPIPGEPIGAPLTGGTVDADEPLRPEDPQFTHPVDEGETGEQQQQQQPDAEDPVEQPEADIPPVSSSVAPTETEAPTSEPESP